MGTKCWWLFTWPISCVLYFTTPDCRKYPKLQFVTFVMCIFWIGTTSYIVAWLITVIGTFHPNHKATNCYPFAFCKHVLFLLGDTLNIPDSVMGLTFLAAGTSVPEAVSSVIVTNQGWCSFYSNLSSPIGD